MSVKSEITCKPAPALTHTGGPLFVDMDGTLVASDLLWESAMLFAARHPFQVWRIPVWLIAGKASLKCNLAARDLPDPATLPYREEVLQFLHSEKLRGRKLILATAADERAAQSVATHLNIFDEIVASDGKQNCAGHRKLDVITSRCELSGFGYIGNSAADLPLWAKADDAYLVLPGARLLRQAKRICSPRRIFHGGGVSTVGSSLRALRPNQWIKNILVLVPLFAAHKFGHLGLLMQALVALACFCAAASSVYILNDLLDLEGDRKHPRKRLRPFAAGTISIPLGLVTAAVLLASSFTTAIILLPNRFALTLGAYFVLAFAYSLFFKRRMLQDVFLLAGLYTLRIIAGGAATGVAISPWLLAFSLFLFLSLAYLKRYAELIMVAERNHKQLFGRSYLTQDIALIQTVGPTSGYLAVMVLCLYINSSTVLENYRRPELLWLLCPIFLYWITRMWFLAQHRTLSDDPVVFAATDRVSLIAALATVVIVVASI